MTIKRRLPLHKRRALEAAIRSAFPYIADARGGRRSIAYPTGWRRHNNASIERHALRALHSAGAKVSSSTVHDAVYERGAYPDDLPLDARRVDTPGNIRDAADLLNHTGAHDRDKLIAAIRAWCAAQVRAGRQYPLEAHRLAAAFRRSLRKVCR